MIMRLRHVALLIIMLGSLAPSSASANPYDISLVSLGRPLSTAPTDPAVGRYRALTGELALALAPRALAPAETMGINGFEFSLVNTLADISEEEVYWQGQPGMPVFEGALASHGSRTSPSMLWIPTLHIRKGLPLSTEVSVTGAYMAFSEMLMLGGDFKIALHESFFRKLPAISIRGAGARLIGSSDIDMVTGEIDVLASMAFGVGGMMQITPYLGGGRVIAHVNSQVLDETPYSVTVSADQRGGSSGSLYTMPTLEWQDNQFTRIFGGLRLNVSFVELLYEADFGTMSYTDIGVEKTLISHSFKIGFDV
ncbi:hypothetical protein KAI87_05670 [Myxococcota bacterium]|nr:hypothetical protein [Myxococcota bacterium]